MINSTLPPLHLIKGVSPVVAAIGEAASLCHTEAGVQHGERSQWLSRDYSLFIRVSSGSSKR